MFSLGFTHSLQVLSEKVSETGATVNNLRLQFGPILVCLQEFESSYPVVNVKRVVLRSIVLQICRVNCIESFAVFNVVNLVTDIRQVSILRLVCIVLIRVEGVLNCIDDVCIGRQYGVPLDCPIIE